MTALTGLSVVAALAGCASSDSTLEDKAHATVSTLLQACAHGEGEAVLDLLTPPQREAVFAASSVHAGCEEVLGLHVESEVLAAEVFRAAVIESVEVNEGFGTATIRGPDGGTSELELENAGDQWLVSNPPLP